MRPSHKGWIHEYINWFADLNITHEFHRQLYGKSTHFNHDVKLYKMVQPTGLMYGHPIRPPRTYDIELSKWNDDEKMKFILLDSLINDSIIFHTNDIHNQQDLNDCINETIDSIAAFYSNNSGKKKSSKSANEQLELMLNRRIGIRTKWSRSFWDSFFQNSLLFLDVYFFGKWMQKKGSVEDLVFYEEQQENLRLDILKIIAAAANSNHFIEEEEQALFSFFLQSANLKKENEKIAKTFLKSNISLEEIEFSNDYSWLIRKYILELAILTVWADKKLEDIEKEFINQLATKLRFSKTELNSSLLAIESFVIANWEQVHFLQSKHNLLIIKDRFSKRISQILHNNKNALVQEMNESKELMMLLRKMTKQELSDIEKSKVRAQLLDILKTLPTFVIVALPGTFITLPLLLNILPKKAFPSAFSEGD